MKHAARLPITLFALATLVAVALAPPAADPAAAALSPALVALASSAAAGDGR